jgi:transposase-like protein
METLHMTAPISYEYPTPDEGDTEGAPLSGSRKPVIISPPDPEVPEKKPRRKFTARYKLRVLAEADACTEQGQLGALLRREGLYSSNLTTWRRQRERGILKAMTPKKRGRKKKQKNPLAGKVAHLEKENERLQKKLKQAELIIDAQKKMSEILRISQDLGESDENK